MHLFSKIYFHRETFSGFSQVTYRTTTSGASPTSSSQEKDTREEVSEKIKMHPLHRSPLLHYIFISYSSISIEII